jgi:hypothetical protein
MASKPEIYTKIQPPARQGVNFLNFFPFLLAKLPAEYYSPSSPFIGNFYLVRTQ